MMQHYRCRCCGSTDIAVSHVYVFTAASGTDYPWGRTWKDEWASALSGLAAMEPDEPTKGPQWGWWAAFYPPHPIPQPRIAERAARPTRGQARGCIKQAQRWKRRRFVQRLRVGAGEGKA